MVVVLLACYNGEAFIAEQLDSLLQQTMQDFVVYIRDDGSIDGTTDIIGSYVAAYPDKFIMEKHAGPPDGAACNFLYLMAKHQADYLMLCDQDDVWLPDKIALTLKKIKQMEAEFGSEMPLLVHTDLQVTHEDLRVRAASYRKAMHANFNKTALHQVLVQNTVTGCAAMYNRALATYMCKKPSSVVMHDWWLELLAAAFGKIGALDAAPILYRQHTTNSIGAGNLNSPRYLLRRFIGTGEIRTALDKTYAQAESLLTCWGDALTPQQRELVALYSAVPRQPKIKRILTVLRLGALKNGAMRRMAQFFYI